MMHEGDSRSRERERERERERGIWYKDFVVHSMVSSETNSSMNIFYLTFQLTAAVIVKIYEISRINRLKLVKFI